MSLLEWLFPDTFGGDWYSLTFWLIHHWQELPLVDWVRDLGRMTVVATVYLRMTRVTAASAPSHLSSTPVHIVLSHTCLHVCYTWLQTFPHASVVHLASHVPRPRVYNCPCTHVTHLNPYNYSWKSSLHLLPTTVLATWLQVISAT